MNQTVQKFRVDDQLYDGYYKGEHTERAYLIVLDPIPNRPSTNQLTAYVVIALLSTLGFIIVVLIIESYSLRRFLQQLQTIHPTDDQILLPLPSNPPS